MFTLQYGAANNRYNKLHIKSYTSDTNAEYITPKTNDRQIHIRKVTVLQLFIYIKDWNKVW